MPGTGDSELPSCPEEQNASNMEEHCPEQQGGWSQAAPGIGPPGLGRERESGDSEATGRQEAGPHPAKESWVSGWLMSLLYSLSSKGSRRACDKSERAEACGSCRQAQVHGVEPRPPFSTSPAGRRMQDRAGCLAALTHIHSHVKEGARSTGSRLLSSPSLNWSLRAPLAPPACSANVGTGAQRWRPGLLSTEHPGHLEKTQFPSGSGQKPFPLRSNLILWAGQSCIPSPPQLQESRVQPHCQLLSSSSWARGPVLLVSRGSGGSVV